MRAKRRISALAILAVIGALLTGAPAARAAGETLQVSREVNAALGGDAVTLTAFANAQGLVVNFDAETGPANTKAPGDPEKTCTTAGSQNSCTVSFTSGIEGTSLIRAWIGPTADGSEARLANTSSLGILDPAADCRVTDDDLLENTCNPGGTPANAGAQAEPDGTDVVQITWTTFATARLDCDDARPVDGEDLEYNNNNNGTGSDRSETYTCTLRTFDTLAPIAGAPIDAEILTGPDANKVTSGADLNDFCTTGADGRCAQTVVISGTGESVTDVCFWGEDPGNQDATFDSNGPADDGGECDGGAEVLDEPEGNDITDVVRLDISNPRATRLDAGPENQTAAPGSRFNFAGAVYDQFGNNFRGDTLVKAELFADSPLDTDGNTPSSPDLSCQTKDQGGCAMVTGAQTELGTNLACLWIDSSPVAENRFSGNNLNGSCGQAGEGEDEIPTDPSADDGVPDPVNDGRDIIRFTIQSRPLVGAVTPATKRQDTSDLLKVVGANFIDGARITISGTGVKLGFTRFVSDTSLEATVEIASDAPPGTRDITVTNPDGGTTTCRLCFKVVGQGYWLVASDGGIFAFGDAEFEGSTGQSALNSPVVGMAPTPSGQGYWFAAADGGVFNFGDAPFVGSAGSLKLSQPIVAIAAHPGGRGYWLVASDGGIFAFGDARFFGSTARLTLAKPIVSIAPTPTGRGYWLVASDGGIFAFGDAKFFGSTGSIKLNRPITTMAPTRGGQGYWLVASDGGVFAFGDAKFLGGTGDIALNQPIVGMTTTPLAGGYWLVASDGGIFAFGDARFAGSTGDIRLNKPIVGMARR